MQHSLGWDTLEVRREGCGEGVCVEEGGGGGATGKGAAFKLFCCTLSGELFDHKFCPMLRTFEFDRAEDWVHLNLSVLSTTGSASSTVCKH